ncbi:NADH:ubiquinone reductase (Na(+)-transporting) subunit B [Reichenbachiella versicolor]|uniref:NADH:ubiquinone reductase (Na(+)-transporting) subunit B n=1 Tax=Reichenbachiella versicolor TaxID=1821036 RepID=UPI000D6DF809|nr:NADH:ubiquinone reductase (Na(+)-transporting) subunit B [Reichenbachiella versicolor]
MKFIEDIFAKIRPNFEKGGKWEKFYYVYEAHEVLLLAPNKTTGPTGAQVRDAIDLKRMMMTVIIAMIPCLIFGIWNAGHQHYISIGEVASLGDKFLTGAILVVPIIAVSYGVGLGIEFTFATINRHEVAEGFLVSGMLIPLVMPASIPLWQVGLATAFAVILGKEVFGGTGMNILNVALIARAFLYFAYPSQISGDVWTYFGDASPVEGFSGATPLAIGALSVEGTQSMVSLLDAHWYEGMFSFQNMFIGIMPGSIGETSTLMCLIGAVILVVTGVGSWKIIVSVFAGAFGMATICNIFGANEYMLLPAHYHLVIGGLAFGAVFMATDPVSAAQTETGKWIYGFLIGALTIIIRVFNPAYPEGIMLAILLMNVFAPLIDHYVVGANIKRRLKRATV